MPNRRVAIQQLALIWAGIAFLPGCLQDEKKVSIPLKNLPITPADENMLAELAETILPKTDTPGAKDLAAHLFTLKMVDDCYTGSNQKNYLQGMKDFEAYAVKKTGKSFVDNDSEQRQAIIADLDRQKPATEGIVYFYQVTKKLTVQAYTTCEYFLTKIRGYKMIPGKFQGCVPLKTV
jgi:Gluconate 2-dehydrogenase subunit 3